MELRKGIDSMDRREFIRNISVGAASLGMAGTAFSLGASTPKTRKPNLLFIWTDEQRADTMAAYDNTKIHVPNLNKLASESFVFKRTYVTQPVCSPSRGSVMTGQWPHTMGIYKNNDPLNEQTRCFPEMMTDAEYQTGYMGKWHLGDEVFPQHGFCEWVSIEDNYQNWYTKTCDPQGSMSDYYHHLVSLGHTTDKPRGFSRSYAAKLPFEQSKPKFLERKACDFLRRHQNEPFMLYVNFLEPHMPFFGPFDNEYNPDDVELPENFNDPLEENEPKAYRMRREKMIKKYGHDEENYRKLIAKYWGLVTEVDTCVGGILKTLDELGLADNTIVVYTSDHGDMMGAHRLVEKYLMYEEAVKVPMLIRIPWISRKQTVIDQPVSHIDLVPTLLDLMQCPMAEDLQGKSLMPLIRGGEIADDHVFIEWQPGQGFDFHVRTVVSPDGWKLSLFKGDKCQLFNLVNDPGETTNLFDSGRHDDIIKRLTRKIKDWQVKTKDTVKFST